MIPSLQPSDDYKLTMRIEIVIPNYQIIIPNARRFQIIIWNDMKEVII